MLYGVDVHDGYQHGLSFPTLVAQGYTFAAVKLTQGTGYVRDQADEWITSARSAGLVPGAYHWLTSADGAAQARWFHQNLAKVGGPDGLLIQLDCEDDGYGPQMTAWAQEWSRLTGGHPFMIYSGAWWWPKTGGFVGASLTPYLWDSHYLSADADTVPDDPAAFAARIPASWWGPRYGGWPTPTFVQFTSKGDAGGLANNVDLNCTRLTREQLLALTGDDMAITTDDAKLIADTIFSRDTVEGSETLEFWRMESRVYQAAQRIDTAVAALTQAIKELPAAVAAAVVGALPASGVGLTEQQVEDAAFRGAQRAEDQ